MTSTFIREDGTRLRVEPSHAFRNVRLWVKDGTEILTIPVEQARAVAQAIEHAALEIERAAMLSTAAGDDFDRETAAA